MATVTMTADEIAYAGGLNAMQLRQEFENDCRCNGYPVGVDFMTMKPIYWQPDLASQVKHDTLRQKIAEDKGLLYTNIGFLCEGIVRG